MKRLKGLGHGWVASPNLSPIYIICRTIACSCLDTQLRFLPKPPSSTARHKVGMEEKSCKLKEAFKPESENSMKKMFFSRTLKDRNPADRWWCWCEGKRTPLRCSSTAIGIGCSTGLCFFGCILRSMPFRQPCRAASSAMVKPDLGSSLLTK